MKPSCRSIFVVYFSTNNWRNLQSDILKADFFCAGKNFSFEILGKKKCKNITKNHLICVKREEKTVKEVKMHKLLVCACNSQDFEQGQKKFARSHDHVTVTFENFVSS